MEPLSPLWGHFVHWCAYCNLQIIQLLFFVGQWKSNFLILKMHLCVYYYCICIYLLIDWLIDWTTFQFTQKNDSFLHDQHELEILWSKVKEGFGIEFDYENGTQIVWNSSKNSKFPNLLVRKNFMSKNTQQCLKRFSNHK